MMMKKSLLLHICLVGKSSVVTFGVVCELHSKVGPMEETCAVEKAARSEAVRAAAECLVIDGSSNIGFSFGESSLASRRKCFLSFSL